MIRATGCKIDGSPDYVFEGVYKESYEEAFQILSDEGEYLINFFIAAKFTGLGFRTG